MTEPEATTADAPATTRSLHRRVVALLRDGPSPVATPELDARLLVGHVLGLDATGFVVHAERAATPADVAAAMALAARRAAGEPVARITGTKGFWSFDLELGPATLVPRPDTETVVEAALAWARSQCRTESPTILDLGTGSGAILLALLSELPAATGVGIDVAEDAARTARRNAEKLGLGERARFVVADWTASLSGRFDLVVSNPPYVRRAEIQELPLEVRRFDPDIALDGGADGLVAYRAILADLDRVLARDGAAFLEVGFDQADPVAGAAQVLGFEARFRKDIRGIDRVVELRRGK